jgi:CheY-like chemotaxis protein
MATILLVADDEAVGGVIEQHLLELGYSVITAPDTSRALSRGRRTAADRPSARGPCYASRTSGRPGFRVDSRGRRPDVPAIFITGYYGFVASSGELPGPILYKPIDLEVLDREISLQLHH